MIASGGRKFAKRMTAVWDEQRCSFSCLYFAVELYNPGKIPDLLL
jgi:hypothetical protein